jgi:hypothetical protein
MLAYIKQVIFQMREFLKPLLISILIGISLQSYSQDITPNIKDIHLDQDKVNIFLKYVEFKHSIDPGGFEGWKKDNPELYLKEMWYYTESFYVKRDHFNDGITLNEGSICIPRFESSRKQNEEAMVVLPGFRDVLILMPTNNLIYKPN